MSAKKLDKRNGCCYTIIILLTEEQRKYMDSDSSDDYDNCYFFLNYKHTYTR